MTDIIALALALFVLTAVPWGLVVVTRHGSELHEQAVDAAMASLIIQITFGVVLVVQLVSVVVFDG